MEMNEEIYGTKTSYVLVEGQLVRTDDTEFINISEDLFGRDVYEFKYKGKCYSSNVILK
jgi:hypothetical protein